MSDIFSFFFFIILVSFAIAGLSLAPWVPTRKKDIQRFLEILHLTKGQKFLEIGCGDGRVSMAVATKFPQSQIVGIELAPPVFIFAYLRKLFFRGDNFKIILGNALKENFGNYDVIYVFGMPDKLQKKIIPKFMKEAKMGAKLYSYVFSIPEEYRENVVSMGDSHEAKIHILEKK